MNVLKLWIATCVIAWNTCGQGVLWVQNIGAPTRIGSASGPVADAGIWGQMLAGPTTDSLTPIGPSLEHMSGYVVGGFVVSTNVPCNTIGYAQLIAWDERLWGTSLDNVPLDQRGATDVVPVGMRCQSPFIAPLFTQPAIVPVPEPGAVSLFCLGCGIAALRLFRKKR